MSDAGVARSALAKRLRSARKLVGLSQAQVAELMDLHRPTISEIEAGRRRVATDELMQFANLYRVSTTWLLGEDDADLSLSAIVAARELKRMKPEDLDRLVEIISAIRGGKGPDG